jgi:TIR domain
MSVFVPPLLEFNLVDLCSRSDEDFGPTHGEESRMGSLGYQAQGRRGMSTKVFLCWSGTWSRHFAAIVRDWLPKVLGPSLQPAVSTQIEKGSAWFDELRNALDNSDCGILCLTAEAIGSPWVHFEEGLLVRALSKSSNPGMAETKHRRVFPLLYDITGEVLKGPLSVYQSTSARDLDDVLPADRGHLPNHAGERADGVH